MVYPPGYTGRQGGPYPSPTVKRVKGGLGSFTSPTVKRVKGRLGGQEALCAEVTTVLLGEEEVSLRRGYYGPPRKGGRLSAQRLLRSSLREERPLCAEVTTVLLREKSLSAQRLLRSS